MHTRDLSGWQHEHRFQDDNRAAERSTRLVMWITAAAMVIEIGAGWWFNSMALLADGWHMSSHAVAIGLSAFAYAAARRYAGDRRFAFGTWKIEVLGGFASALFLLGAAALMVIGSLQRLWAPAPIQYREAIVVAVLGLSVNLLCAWLLAGAHHHHEHGRESNHEGHAHSHGHDLNLRSAYLHVVADAATSVLAIVALAGGWLYGWAWLDPAMGIVGAVLVASWARGLLVDTAKVLLDREMDHPVVEEIRDGVERAHADSHTRIADLHVWRVGQGAYACALSVVTHSSTLTPDEVRATFAMHEEIRHSTIEIHRCHAAA
ncbi:MULTISPECIES: CDF family Co(II)/Ni(II) efflux transporter DmeF [unclassified Variovorax]|uniref:CDF family Co(II)/Ni(II) efflux transporter DmeF n=1 Tax=unclassified Variovorax TaxID=663243 RepID=UPI00076C9525|nr:MULTISPECIES: CDF family Co(II)/Ni(II) efflux transporter DmeF [unclassified Variovorax]KWT72301.1 Cobalt-zinc-cadmium resistance protein CzcD [Variovorax sp. WDL1]PNG53248.1 Cadmium, cobalt and zinc/H(+)-K(+) antiporter [Variovorax sp. B2]PNG53820.1 Cadmium, cobalt and zinc/H(+)-K(+) antiporter [Variovorax sp. B4]VTV11279.1 Cadmium, cobalt and zinc/H(+)-K(+) antiporter [Variovorax sp. WDL1]